MSTEKEENREILPDVLILMRFALGLSREDIANALGVSDSAVSTWETGKHSPPKTTKILLANILRITVDELTGKVPLSAEANALIKIDMPALLEKLEAAKEANEEAIQVLRQIMWKTNEKKAKPKKKKTAKK